MNFFSGQQRETLRQVKSHLMAENRLRADPGAVMLDHTFVHNPSQQVQILSHTTENCQMIASSKVSSGRRTVVGYSGLFGESGQCWHSMATPS